MKHRRAGGRAGIWSAYALDLNSDEGIWHYLTHVALRNLCCHDLGDLRQALRAATKPLHHKRRVIAACFAHAGYDPPG